MDPELKMMLDVMRHENSQNFASMTEQMAELKTDVADLKLSLDCLDQEVRVLRDETIPVLRKGLMKEIEDLRKQRLLAELYSKKANLLFYGIDKRSADEDCEAVIREFLKKELKLADAESFLFANCHRLPSSHARSGLAPDPIIVKFIKMKERDLVQHSAPRLKQSKHKFGISPHIPREMQLVRRGLLPLMKQAIASGKKAHIKTIGTEVKLFIDNKLYTP